MLFIQMAASDTSKLQNYQLTNIVAMVSTSKKDILPPIFLLDAERFKTNFLKMHTAFTHDQGNALY